MSRTFLPNTLIYFLMCLCGFSLIFFTFESFVILSSASLGLFVLFRKRKFIYRDRVKRNENMYVSPVNAVIEKIKENVEVDGKNYIEITTVMGVFNEWGLYLPMSAQVEKVHEQKGSRVFRFSDVPAKDTQLIKKRHLTIEIYSKERKQSLLRFFPCKTGFSPILWPIAGDRGLLSSSFGLFPMGGIVQIYIPVNSKLYIEVGDLLHAGDTVMANLQ